MYVKVTGYDLESLQAELYIFIFIATSREAMGFSWFHIKHHGFSLAVKGPVDILGLYLLPTPRMCGALPPSSL
jgi:hypothetical protein